MQQGLLAADASVDFLPAVKRRETGMDGSAFGNCGLVYSTTGPATAPAIARKFASTPASGIGK
jgi:hypothetical protein